MRLRNLMALAVAVGLSVVGCTRGTSTQGTVSLKFSAKDIGALAQELGVIVINVSGGKLAAPKNFFWDRHSCGQDDCKIPSEFEVSDIPAGGEVYVQVLTVWEEQTSGAMVFKYADVNKPIVSGKNEVTLTPLTIGGATTEAHFYGRFLDRLDAGGAPSGPTGVVEMRFKPPASASVKADPPSLMIQTGYIFAGWASIMAFDGDIKFDYYLNGSPLIAGVNIQKLQALAGNALMMVDVPDFERSQGLASSLELEHAQKIFLGYIGAAPLIASQTACFHQGSGHLIDYAYVAGTSGGTMLQFNGSITTANALEVAVQAGGVAYDPNLANSCSNPTTLFTNQLIFNYKNLRNGKDSVAGFQGPFRQVSLNGDMVLGTALANGALRTEFKMLPGTTGPTAISAARVLKRPATGHDDDLHGQGDGVACSALASKGFVPMGADIAIPTGAVDISATFPNANGGAGLDIVLCPMMAGKLIDAGVKLHDVRTPPVFKLVGNNTSITDTSGAGFGPETHVHRSQLQNNYYVVIAQVNNQYIPNSDIDGADFSIDGGAWTPAESMVNMSYVGIGASGAASFQFSATNPTLMSALAASNANGSLRFRWRLKPAAISYYNLQDINVVSEPLTMVGENSCAMTNLQAFDLDQNVFLSSSAIMVSNTDQKRRIEMRWNGAGCTGDNWAAVPLNYMSVGAGALPTGCFSKMDYKRPTALEIVIDPVDSFGQDCDLSGAAVAFQGPGGVHVVNVSAGTIAHSTTPAILSSVPTATDLSNISDYGFFLDLVQLGQSGSFTTKAFRLNSDGKLIANNAAAGAGTTWSDIGGGWLSSFFGTGGYQSLATQSSPVASAPVRMFVANEGAATGGFPYMVAQMGNVVSASSATNFGSSILLIDNGAGYTLGFYPKKDDTFVGQSFVSLGWPPGVVNSNGGAFAKVFLVENSGRQYVFLALQDGATANYALGALNFMNGVYTLNWMPTPVKNPGHTIFDVRLGQYMGQPTAQILRDESGTKKYAVQVFGYIDVANTWHNAAISGGNSSTLNASNFASVIGFADCGSQVLIAGRESTTSYLHLATGDLTGGSYTDIGSRSVVVSGYSKVACSDFGTGGSAKLLALYHPTSGAVLYSAMEGPSVSCGASNPWDDLPINGSASALTPSTGGHRAIFGGFMGLTHVFQEGGATVVKSAEINCSATAGQAEWGSIKTRAQFSTSASSINGAGITTGHGPAGMALWGTNSQYYQLRSR